MKRPAETSGVAAAVALLIARIAGVTDANTIVAMAVVVGFIPAAVTWTVEQVKGRNTSSTSNGG